MRKRSSKYRILSVLISALMVLTTMMPAGVFGAEGSSEVGAVKSEEVSAAAELMDSSIQLGDYVQMGTYYGEPILWRCVAFYKVDDEGNVDLTDTSKTYEEGYLPLMLSDKIICLKAFDASGTDTSGSHGRGDTYSGTKGYWRQEFGSNFWGDSNIRDWLNSTASSGNVNWSCGNPPDEEHVYYNEYDDEAGFLTNFTASEQNAVKKVRQYTTLDMDEYDDMSGYGSTYHYSGNGSIASGVQNANTTAYKQKFSDKMFLMDVNQVHEVYENSDVLGDSYYVGEPTSKCVSNSEYTDSDLQNGKKWYCWLRSPDANGYYGSSYVLYVSSVGDAYYVNLAYYGNRGVRPAFFLNPESESFDYGDGSEASPYSIENYYTLTFETNGGNEIDSVNSWEGEEISLSEYIPEKSNCTFKGWYSDEELTDEITEVTLYENMTIYAGWIEKGSGGSSGGGGGIGEILDSGNCGENLTWEFDDKGSLYISGTGEMYDYDAEKAPWYDYNDEMRFVIIEDGVKSIGEFAFYYCYEILHISIPEGIETIGDSAFSCCDGLECIEIPESVDRIGDCVFECCYGLTDIYVNEKNSYYKDIDGVLYTKDGKKLILYPIAKEEENYVIEEGVEEIAEGAFEGCNNDLVSVEIPESVKKIGDSAFWNCDSIESIEIPEKVEEIGYDVFGCCYGLTDINVSEKNAYYKDIDGVLYNKSGKKLIIYPAGKEEENYVIEAGVEEIAENAFSGCRNLVSVEIPESVKSIGDYAFSHCANLESIEIPEKVEEIGYSAFRCCYGLTDINVSEKNAYYKDIDGVLYTKDVKKLILYPIAKEEENYVIEEGVEEIAEDAFSDCDSLESIEIPKSVKMIGRSAFSHCGKLNYIEIPKSVESIGNYAFRGCENLTSVVFSEGIKTIQGNNVFYGCSSLKQISLPKSLVSVGEGALDLHYYQSGKYVSGTFDKVYYGGTESDWDKIVFEKGSDAVFEGAVFYYESEDSNVYSLKNSASITKNDIIRVDKINISKDTDENSFSGTLSVENLKDCTRNFTAIVSTFDKYGKMIEADLVTDSIAGNEEKDVSFNLKKFEDGYSVRVILFDENKMPLCSAFKFVI